MFGIFAALAEFERELIRERTVAGLADGRAAGKFVLVESPGEAGLGPVRDADSGRDLPALMNTGGAKTGRVGAGSQKRPIAASSEASPSVGTRLWRSIHVRAPGAKMGS